MSSVKIESIEVVQDMDESPDMSHLGEYTNVDAPGAIDRKERGDMERGTYQYFVPGNHAVYNPDNWAHVSKANKRAEMKKYGVASLAKVEQAYAMQAYKRCESYNQGEWHYIGIVARAEVSTPSTGVIKGTLRLETLSSSGLWGIESDSDADYIADIAKEQLAELKEHLETFNVDTSNFDALAESALSEL